MLGRVPDVALIVMTAQAQWSANRVVLQKTSKNESHAIQHLDCRRFLLTEKTN